MKQDSTTWRCLSISGRHHNPLHHMRCIPVRDKKTEMIGLLQLQAQTLFSIQDNKRFKR